MKISFHFVSFLKLENPKQEMDFLTIILEIHALSPKGQDLPASINSVFINEYYFITHIPSQLHFNEKFLRIY